jgi:heme exporter protein D
MGLGAHTDFVVAAYAVALAVILGLLAWIVLDHGRQRRVLAELEARGVRRRARNADRAEEP